MTDLDVLLSAVREGTARAAARRGRRPEAFRAVAEELRPFVDAAARSADPERPPRCASSAPSRGCWPTAWVTRASPG
ncbi:MAG: hypothetical protein U0325_20070 [Polyangiales bacterium]